MVSFTAFADELQKIALAPKTATMVKYTKKLKLAAAPAKKANRYFGLPIEHPKARRYEQSGSAAQSADRSQYPIAGDMTPNISIGNTFMPQTGPAGV